MTRQTPEGNRQELCPERVRLMQEYIDAVRVHSGIVESYKEAQRKPGFDAVLRRGQRASIAAATAHLALETHMAEHGCGGNE